jgi:hypothetical protein
MKITFLFLPLLILIPSLIFAQDGRDEIKYGVGPFEYETEVVHKEAIYENGWKRFDSSYYYEDEYSGSVAYRLNTDSFRVLHRVISGKITNVDTIRKGRTNMALVIYSDNTGYGSGGGSGENSVTIIRIDTCLISFRAVIGTMTETFGRRDIEAEYLSCRQKVDIADNKIALKKPQHSKKIHLESGGCGLTFETAQTFIYKNGKYQKYMPPKKQTAGK